MAVFQSIEWYNTIINWKFDFIDISVRVWYEMSWKYLYGHWYIIFDRDLDSNYLIGTIPDSIGNLTSLNTLYVFDMKWIEIFERTLTYHYLSIELCSTINWVVQYHHQLVTWLHWIICTYLIWNELKYWNIEWKLIYYLFTGIWIPINWVVQYLIQLETWFHWLNCTYMKWIEIFEWTLIYYISIDLCSTINWMVQSHHQLEIWLHCKFCSYF